MKAPGEVLERAETLRHLHDGVDTQRHRTRAILNGGRGAVRALLGDKAAESDIPVVNMMLSGLEALSHKLGQLPQVRVDTPAHVSDSDRVFKHAEKRERIVEAYDDFDRVELQLPQVGLWLPGYGFAVWLIRTRLGPDGVPYPSAELRDPYDCYPGEWGVHQQPAELACYMRVPLPQLVRMYPKAAGRLMKQHGNNMHYTRASGGGVVLTQGQWANQTDRGVTVVEYLDADGTHTLIPSIAERVRFDPNPLESGPAFVVAKRFAFDRLTGHYEHIISLMAMMSKLNALGLLAIEDSTFAPTNVRGEVISNGGQYKVGRNVVNLLAPGSEVDHPNKNVPYQMFEAINRVERQIRIMAGYPVTDDSQSPTSWVTGAGIDSVTSSNSNEVREYQKVIRHALQDIDSKRLEWDHKVSGSRKKLLVGQRKGQTFAESYTPTVHIGGNYRTRRLFGVLAGWDENAKIVGGVQMVGAGLMDRQTFMENISGFDNVPRMLERIDADQARLPLQQALVSAAQNGDQRAVMALIEMLPQGEFKKAMQHFFTPEGDEMTPEEQAMATATASSGAETEDPMTTILSRLTGRGGEGGIQTVAQI